MTTLFNPHRLADLDLPNRIVMAPMTRVRATADGPGDAVDGGLLRPARHRRSHRQRGGAPQPRRPVQCRHTGAGHRRAGGVLAPGHRRFAVEAVEATVDAIGARRTGIRLSPGVGLWGAEETDVPELYAALLAELNRFDLAYLHLEATTDTERLLVMRQAWKGTLIMNPTDPTGPARTDCRAADEWLGLGADLISFGRAFISNPDLVERLRAGAPLAEDDQATWYEGGDSGYLDYPTHTRAA